MLPYAGPPHERGVGGVNRGKHLYANIRPRGVVVQPDGFRCAVERAKHVVAGAGCSWVGRGHFVATGLVLGPALGVALTLDLTLGLVLVLVLVFVFVALNASASGVAESRVPRQVGAPHQQG